MKTTVDASTRTFIRFWLVPLGLGVAGYALYSARTALIILGSALFLALALNNPVSKLAQYLPGKSRVMSTAVSFVIVIAILGGFVFLAVPPIVQQTTKFAQTVPSLVDDAQSQWKGFRDIIHKYNLEPQIDQATKSIQNNASSFAQNVGSNAVSFIGSTISFVTAMILALVLAFLMLIEGPTWMRKLWGLYQDPKKRDYHHAVVHRMHSVVSSYVTGQLTVSGLGALFAGLFVFILSFFFDVPANLSIPAAAITFVLSLIPMFGAMIGGGIVTLLLLFNAPGAALAYLVFFIIYQQLENNYISPTIQSKRLELSPLAILAAVTIGLYLFGIAGGIISIPIAGCIKVLVDTYLERSAEERKKHQSPLGKLVGRSKA